MGCRIDLSVQMIAAERIGIGDRVEILRGCTIDGRGAASAIEIGSDCRIKENVWIATYGGSVQLGNEVFVSRNVVLAGHGGIEIGDYASLGPNVVIVSHRQRRETTERYHVQGFVPQAVTLGDDSHLGAGVVVTAGVSIGARAYVGANSVVTRDLEGGYVYAGVPARRIGPFQAVTPDGPVRYHSDWDGSSGDR
jgi:maltose O-acetyltransferase